MAELDDASYLGQHRRQQRMNEFQSVAPSFLSTLKADTHGLRLTHVAQADSCCEKLENIHSSIFINIAICHSCTWKTLRILIRLVRGTDR